jgi:hypothetical protein
LLRVDLPWRWRVACAVVDVEAIDMRLARGHGRCLVPGAARLSGRGCSWRCSESIPASAAIDLSGSGGRLDNLRNCPLHAMAHFRAVGQTKPLKLLSVAGPPGPTNTIQWLMGYFPAQILPEDFEMATDMATFCRVGASLTNRSRVVAFRDGTSHQTA